MNNKILKEQKIVIWDNSEKYLSRIKYSEDLLSPFWPETNYQAYIDQGLPREVAYWQFRIRKSLQPLVYNQEFYDKKNTGFLEEFCQKVSGCKSMEDMEKILESIRKIMFPYGESDRLEKPIDMSVDRFYILANVGVECADLLGSEEEMYRERFAITDTVIRNHAESRFLILHNHRDIEFTGKSSATKEYPEILYKNKKGESSRGIIVSPQKGRSLSDYEENKYSVFSLTPAKEERWLSSVTFGKRYYHNEDWDRLKPVKLNIILEEAVQLFNEKVNDLILKEKKKLFPGRLDPDVQKEAEPLIQMGFEKCTAAHSGAVLVRQLKETAAAFKELASLFQVPEYCISIYGKLNLAFAANLPQSGIRGFYTQRILCIREDNGCLAHEWYHAAEHNYPVIDNKIGEVFSAIDSLAGDKEADYYKRCVSRDKACKNGEAYFSDPREMSARAFETYISLKTNNPFLTNKKAYDRDVYPTEEELQPYILLFKKLFRRMRAFEKERKPAEKRKEMKYEEKKYSYFLVEDKLLRRSIINPYQGMELLTDKGWKYLTREQQKNYSDKKMTQVKEKAAFDQFLHRND